MRRKSSDRLREPNDDMNRDKFEILPGVLKKRACDGILKEIYRKTM